MCPRTDPAGDMVQMIVAIILPAEAVIKKGMLEGLPTRLSSSEKPCRVCLELDEPGMAAYCDRAKLPEHMALSLVEFGRSSEENAIDLQQRALLYGVQCPVSLMISSDRSSKDENTGIDMAAVESLASSLGGVVVPYGDGPTWKAMGRQPCGDSVGKRISIKRRTIC